LHTKKVVITGGPSTGKTAVIDTLESEGFTCLHEGIRAMTKEQKGEAVEFKSNPIVSVADPMAFNQTILEARIQQYQSVSKEEKEVVFFDRGIPDVLAYMDCFGQTYDATFTDACHVHRYNQVFLMPHWKEIHVSDNERFESFEESLKVHACLMHSYAELGYEVIIVPKASIQERVSFILNTLNLSP